MTEQISNVMADAVGARVSDWAIAHARAFHDEVQRRVDAGWRRAPANVRA